MGDTSGLGSILGQGVDMAANLVGRSKGEAQAREGMDAVTQAYLEQLGILTPTLDTLDVEQQQGTGLNNIVEDQRLRGYQLQALSELGNIANMGGAATAQDFNAYQHARQEAGSVDAGLRGAAQQRAQERGMVGSNAGLMSDLLAGQQSTNRASQMQTQAASDSRDRYLQALGELGSQAGGVRGQDYGIASQKAQAQDAINRFNAGMRWTNATYNQNQAQQNFNNQMDLAGQRMGAANSYNNARRGRAQDNRNDGQYWGEALGNFTNSLVSSAGGGGGGGGGFGF